MFTGIVEELGQVVGIRKFSGGIILSVTAKKIIDNNKIGDSVCVNGVCLTLVKITPTTLDFEVMSSTLKGTNLKNLRTQGKVNLERALTLQSRISGHLVLGHIDDVGMIKSKKNAGGNIEITVKYPSNLSPYIVSKGSVAVDGVSLTVNSCTVVNFSVFIIPHTFKNTTLGFKEVGSTVNIEVDIIGKYIEKMMKR